jgi:hypothetical protein
MEVSMKRFAVAAISLGLLTSVAAAATPAPAPTPQRVKNVAIEAEELKGEVPVPHMEQIVGRKPTEQGSLIRARTDFVYEIVKSAENL